MHKLVEISIILFNLCYILKGGQLMINATVEEKLKSEAEFGLFVANFKIGKTKANELRQNGLEVTDLKEFNYFPRVHRISWKEARVECKDVKSLDENDSKYSFAQKLWILSMKNQPSAPWIL